VAALIALCLLAAGSYVLAVAARSGASHRSAGGHPPATTTPRDLASTTDPAPTSSSSTTSAPSEGNTVTIAAVGDTMLGNAGELPPDPESIFAGVDTELTSGAQIVFANLEGTLTDATTSKCGPKGSIDCYAFKDPPSYAQYFKKAGFTVLNDANNHSYDFGPAGQAQTVQVIHAAGMAQTGLPGEITLVTANRVRVALCAFAPYSYDADLLDFPAAQALIEQAHEEAPIVVVYMHAGAEGAASDQVTDEEETYLGEDRGNPEAFAHMAIDSGASLVIASGPHVLRGMQFYKGRLIAYSLGDFADYGDFASSGVLRESVILHVTLSPTGSYLDAKIDPILLEGEGTPEPGGGAVQFVAQLSQEDFGASAARFSASGEITAP
jgi:hypothetical protein